MSRACLSSGKTLSVVTAALVSALTLAVMACGGGSQEMPDVDATVALPIDGLEEFNEAIKLNPDNADAYYNRGVTYRKLGQHERAIEDYNEAIRLRPQFAFPYYNRGLSYRELGQNEQAERDFAKVKKLG